MPCYATLLRGLRLDALIARERRGLEAAAVTREHDAGMRHCAGVRVTLTGRRGVVMEQKEAQRSVVPRCHRPLAGMALRVRVGRGGAVLLVRASELGDERCVPGAHL
jgi:hypothetical protein